MGDIADHIEQFGSDQLDSCDPFWVQADGINILITAMTDKHLKNAAKMCEKNGYSDRANYLFKQLKERKSM